MKQPINFKKHFAFASVFISYLIFTLTVFAAIPPSNLRIKSANDNIAILAWDTATSDSQTVSYEVYRNGSLLATLAGNVTGYVDQTVQAHNYQYEIYAVDASGQKSLPASTTINLAPMGITLRLKAFLQGAYQASTGEMRDNLRLQQAIPITEPYMQLGHNLPVEVQLNPALLDVTGSDAIVDWMIFELRDKTNPRNIIRNEVALLQRDGHLIDPQTGRSVFYLNDQIAGDYYIALRHRNHLGVMTANAVKLSATERLIDFSDVNTATWGNNARLISNNIALMWAGDGNHDGKLIASGPQNDLNYIISSVLLAEDNIGFNANYIYTGYNNVDINLDGNVIYIGKNNDGNITQGNVLLNPSNTSFNSNFIIEEQLPKVLN